MNILHWGYVGEQKYGVMSDDGKTIYFWGLWNDLECYKWQSETDMKTLTEDRDPFFEPTCHYKIEPENPGKLVWLSGTPGSGKSTLCNVISGKKHNDSNDFPVRSSMKSSTNVLKQSNELWQGNGFNFTVIDTPGLRDSHGDNAKFIFHMAQMLSKLKSVDLFLIVIQKGTTDFSAVLREIEI